MYSCRLPAWRLRIDLSRPFGPTQRRWARVHDIRFLATHQTQERITDRYREKLNQRAKECVLNVFTVTLDYEPDIGTRKGLQNIEQLKEIYKDEIADLRKKATVPGGDELLKSHSQQPGQTQSSSPWPKPPPPPSAQTLPDVSSDKPPGVKTLSSFLDVSKALDLPQREIEALWRLRHANSPQSLCATMPSSMFANIARTARQHPQFILPGLPAQAAEGGNEAKDANRPGAAIHFVQWTFPSPETATVLFTHLAEYKLRGEHAQPHTTLTHHLELADPKGIVLCQGNVVPDRGVNMEEGKWLLLQLQKFYNIGEEVEASESSSVGKELKKDRRRLVEMFSQGSADFKVEELLEAAERMG